MVSPILFIVAVGAALALLCGWGRERSKHNARLDSLDIRVHVNGIRGKSTVTRLIAGALRENGIATVAKTTGTAAVVIGPDGRDEPIIRRGAATILEQVDVIGRHVTAATRALVIECMALKPAYQEVAERTMVRSTIGVITNVREDHQDVMGETLTEIARSLMSSCPRGGILVTGEQDSAILAVMAEEARVRDCELIVADPSTVTDAELARFSYLSFKDNVAVALAVARLSGVPREVALDGMVEAAPDPGVTRLTTAMVGRKRVTWANLFAVNDRESTIATLETISATRPRATKVAILNNRADRGRRAQQFADIAARDLNLDFVITFGAYERVVTARMVEQGLHRQRILNLGDDANPTFNEILDRIAALPGDEILLAGLVNIHTHQAEMLLEFFETGARPHTPIHTVPAALRTGALTFEAA